MKNNLANLISARIALQHEIKDKQHELRKVEVALCDEVFSFNGSLTDAIALGLVKPAFPLPRAAMDHISARRDSIL